eukprot:s4375_g4.t1
MPTYDERFARQYRYEHLEEGEEHAGYPRDYLLRRLKENGALKKKMATDADAMVDGWASYWRWWGDGDCERLLVRAQREGIQSYAGRVARLQATFAEAARSRQG